MATVGTGSLTSAERRLPRPRSPEREATPLARSVFQFEIQLIGLLFDLGRQARRIGELILFRDQVLRPQGGFGDILLMGIRPGLGQDRLIGLLGNDGDLIFSGQSAVAGRLSRQTVV